ncbi:capsid cement protein [Stenotrophomonas riyadhensis]
MAQNFVSDGDVIPWTNTTEQQVASGQAVVVGHQLGVALVNIAAGATGSVALGGVFTLPKVPTAVFEQGEKLVWSASAKAVDGSSATAVAGDITGAAFAWAAGSAGQATAEVRLSPGNATKA